MNTPPDKTLCSLPVMSITLTFGNVSTAGLALFPPVSSTSLAVLYIYFGFCFLACRLYKHNLIINSSCMFAINITKEGQPTKTDDDSRTLNCEKSNLLLLVLTIIINNLYKNVLTKSSKLNTAIKLK